MADQRRDELAKIHIARQQLGMDYETYRDMLEAQAGVRSSAKLDADGRRKVLDHLRSRGAVFKRTKRPRPAQARTPLLSKIYAQLGERPVSYAEGILKQMYGDEAPAKLEWANTEQLRKIVAALSYDQRRHSR